MPASERLPLRTGAWVPTAYPRTNAAVYRADVYRDGYPAIVLQSAHLRLIVSPCAGARALVFEDRASGENLFTTIGGFRDAWLQQLPPSPRDYIGKYTHPIAAGTFNRCYGVTIDARHAQAVFTYNTPDAPPHGAAFRKSIGISGNGDTVTVALDAVFRDGGSQRAQQITSFALDAFTQLLQLRNAVGIYDPHKRRLLATTWDPADIEKAAVTRNASDALLTLTYAAGGSRSVRYTVVRAENMAAAQARLRELANRP